MKILTTTLLLSLCMMGCNRNNKTANTEVYVDSVADTVVQEEEMGQPQTHRDWIRYQRKQYGQEKSPSFWDFIDDTIYAMIYEQEMFPRREHYAGINAGIDKTVSKIGADSGWVKPYFRKIEKGLKPHIQELNEEAWSNNEQKISYNIISCLWRYIDTKKGDMIQGSFDSAMAAIDIRKDMSLMEQYMNAVWTFMGKQLDEFGRGSFSWICYYDEEFGLLEEYYNLLCRYEAMARHSSFSKHNYRSIDPAQFTMAFNRLCGLNKKFSKEGRDIEKAYNNWMNHRFKVSERLAGDTKEWYDEATYRLQYYLLIEIKNQYENYGLCSNDVIELSLPKDCSYKELLADPCFDVKWKEYSGYDLWEDIPE